MSCSRMKMALRTRFVPRAVAWRLCFTVYLLSMFVERKDCLQHQQCSQWCVLYKKRGASFGTPFKCFWINDSAMPIFDRVRCSCNRFSQTQFRKIPSFYWKDGRTITSLRPGRLRSRIYVCSKYVKSSGTFMWLGMLSGNIKKLQ